MLRRVLLPSVRHVRRGCVWLGARRRAQRWSRRHRDTRDCGTARRVGGCGCVCTADCRCVCGKHWHCMICMCWHCPVSLSPLYSETVPCTVAVCIVYTCTVTCVHRHYAVCIGTVLCTQALFTGTLTVMYMYLTVMHTLALQCVHWHRDVYTGTVMCTLAPWAVYAGSV